MLHAVFPECKFSSGNSMTGRRYGNTSRAPIVWYSVHFTSLLRWNGGQKRLVEVVLIVIYTYDHFCTSFAFMMADCLIPDVARDTRLVSRA